MQDVKKRFIASRKRVRKIRGKMKIITKNRARAMRRRKARGL
jgi:hypothetical protein